MGWDVIPGQTVKEAVAEAIAPRKGVDGTRWRTVAHRKIGRVLWQVIEVAEPGSAGPRRFISCTLIERDRALIPREGKGLQGPAVKGAAVKVMHESEHPYFYSCPLAFLDMAPVACQEWRDMVIRRAKEVPDDDLRGRPLR